MNTHRRFENAFADRAQRAAILLGASTLLAACSQTPTNPATGVTRDLFTEAEYGVSSSPRVVTHSGPVRKGGGRLKLGSPYKVAGRWYVPRDEPGYDRQGVGSWYGADFHGRKTANGEIFDKNALTAAHPTLPLPSYAYVTNLRNGRTVMVRINDRGPYVSGRIIDLSHASARAIGYDAQGHAPVRVRYAGRAPLNGDDRRERQFLAQQRGGSSQLTSFAPESDGGARPRAGMLQSSAARAWEPRAQRPSGNWSPTAYRLQLQSRSAGRSSLGGPSVDIE